MGISERRVIFNCRHAGLHQRMQRNTRLALEGTCRIRANNIIASRI